MAGLMIVNPSRRKRRKAPAKSRARKATTVTVKRRRKSALRSNPVPGFHKARRRKSASRRVRRNPIGGRAEGFLKPLMNAVPGAVGAIGVNLILSKLPLPDVLTTGAVKHVARVGIILGLGMLANKVSRSPMIGQAVQGALTVSVYESIKELMSNAGFQLNGIGTDEMGYYSPATTVDGYVDNPALGEYPLGVDDGLSEYVSADDFAMSGEDY